MKTIAFKNGVLAIFLSVTSMLFAETGRNLIYVQGLYASYKITPAVHLAQSQQQTKIKIETPVSINTLALVAVESDAQSIHQQSDKISALKNSARKQVKEKDKAGLVKTRQQLAQARYEKFRQQVYFLLDREALRRQHMFKLQEIKKDIAHKQNAVVKTKVQLKKAIKRNDQIQTLQLATSIGRQQQALLNAKQLLLNERQLLKKDMKYCDDLYYKRK